MCPFGDKHKDRVSEPCGHQAVSVSGTSESHRASSGHGKGLWSEWGMMEQRPCERYTLALVPEPAPVGCIENWVSHGPPLGDVCFS